jgi:hypothetical protein
MNMAPGVGDTWEVMRVPSAKIVSLANPNSLPVLEWQEYLGQPLERDVYLVAFQDEATASYFLYEVGYNESDLGLTNVSGVFIPNIWAVAPLESPND